MRGRGWLGSGCSWEACGSVVSRRWANGRRPADWRTRRNKRTEAAITLSTQRGALGLGQLDGGGWIWPLAPAQLSVKVFRADRTTSHKFLLSRQRKKAVESVPIQIKRFHQRSALVKLESPHPRAADEEASERCCAGADRVARHSALDHRLLLVFTGHAHSVGSSYQTCFEWYVPNTVIGSGEWKTKMRHSPCPHKSLVNLPGLEKKPALLLLGKLNPKKKKRLQIFIIKVKLRLGVSHYGFSLKCCYLEP